MRKRFVPHVDGIVIVCGSCRRKVHYRGLHTFGEVAQLLEQKGWRETWSSGWLCKKCHKKYLEKEKSI